MKKILLTILLSVFLLPALPAQEAPDFSKIPAEQFLQYAIHRLKPDPQKEIWMKMNGKIQHRRKGYSTLTSTIRLGVLFMPARATGVLSLDEGAESYRLTQQFTVLPTPPSCIAAGNGKDGAKAKLPVFGLSPNDLMLGFLYRKPVREEEQTHVSIYNTRVFVMFLPKGTDGDKDFDQYARVYISTDYLVPLKVEWFKTDPGKDTEPYRAFEITAIKKINDFIMVSKMRLDGPDWRTKIAFNDLDIGIVDESGAPKDLFNLK